MPENGNIEELAKIISRDIFKWLKWKTSPSKDENWDCVSDHHHKKTHPSDVVFYYDDPYSGDTKYINTDLKSYAKGSITRDKLKKAITSLALSVECANISSSWQEKFIISQDNFEDTCGLLFIYNHDNQYDKNFDQDIIQKIDFENIPIAEHNEIFIFGPGIIEKLNNIISDIKMLIADQNLSNEYTFFYPDLIRSRRCGDEWNKPATLEAITAPWLILKHKDSSESKSGFIIYYHNSGETIDEFIYLIDAMSHYQMFSSEYRIRVRLTNPSKEAPISFEKAKLEYLKIWGNDEARNKQMNRIEVESITNFTKSFNPMEIGMRFDD